MRFRRKWLLVSAGLGSPEFEAAALRIARQSRKFSQVGKVVVVRTDELKNTAVEVSRKYKSALNASTYGYGYMTWKSEIVNLAMSGFWGDFSGVIWVDSGCELNANLISKIRLESFLKKATKEGVFCFTLDTPESIFTKADVLNYFPEVNPVSKQIQTTWFALHGEKGKKIAQEWLSWVLKGIEFSDMSESLNGESKNFIAHRNDQSIFSLICKQNGVVPSSYIPVNGKNGILSQLKAVTHPIWASRNRTGDSIKNVFTRMLEW